MWVKKSFRAGCDKNKCKCAESMWVRVKSIKDNGIIVGQLHNDPVCYPSKWGAKVEVKPEEITGITVGEEGGEESTQLFLPQGKLPRAPRPYAPGGEQKFSWVSMAAAVLAGITLATLISSYARSA